jgi:hypothetical protein
MQKHPLYLNTRWRLVTCFLLRTDELSSVAPKWQYSPHATASCARIRYRDFPPPPHVHTTSVPQSVILGPCRKATSQCSRDYSPQLHIPPKSLFMTKDCPSHAFTICSSGHPSSQGRFMKISSHLQSVSMCITLC